MLTLQYLKTGDVLLKTCKLNRSLGHALSLDLCTSVLVWFWPCWLGLLWSSVSPAVTLSTSSESMLDAEAELMLERWDGASCSLTAPTDPVLRCCAPPDDPDPEEGRLRVAEETEDEEDEEEDV